MDFTKLDNRAAAETGVRHHILHPSTREPIGNGKDAAIVIVRGVASRTVQAAIRSKQKSRAANAKSDSLKKIMDDTHNYSIDSALPYIAGFENVEMDGKPVTTDEADIRRWLDLTFPLMAVAKDEDGRVVMDEHGNPKIDILSYTFAAQIADVASRQGAALGN